MNNSPISICFIAPKAYGLFNPSVQTGFGGAEVDLYMLSTELAKDPAFAVSFITADYNQPHEQIIENVRLIKSLNFKQNPLTGAWKIYRALKKARACAYLLKTASPGVPLVYAFCRLHRRKFLYRTAHTREADGAYRQQHPLLARLFEYSLRHADKVFTQNRHDADLLKQNIRIDALVIPNGHRIRPADEAPRDSVLWVGHGAGFKHPGRFLELARRFPAENFTMICRPATGDKDYDELRRQAAGVDNLAFLSDVPFAEINKYFSRAKVFVNTSDAEGFPNTFIQAAAAGAAILTFAVNPDDFLTQYGCGLESEADTETLAKNLAFLLENDRFTDFGPKAVDYMKQNHDIERFARQYKTVLKKLCGE